MQARAYAPEATQELTTGWGRVRRLRVNPHDRRSRKRLIGTPRILGGCAQETHGSPDASKKPEMKSHPHLQNLIRLTRSLIWTMLSVRSFQSKLASDISFSLAPRTIGGSGQCTECQCHCKYVAFRTCFRWEMSRRVFDWERDTARAWRLLDGWTRARPLTFPTGGMGLRLQLLF